MSKIDPHYFDLQIYAIYRALWERWGDEAWHVVWRSGEVLFDEIEPTLGLTPDDTPFTAMRRLADYLRQVGYVEDITVRQTGEGELEYEMLNPVIPGPGWPSIYLRTDGWHRPVSRIRSAQGRISPD